MREWSVTVVPNCLDTTHWAPLKQNLARELLGLPRDVPLLLFGAMGGGRDPRKGFDLLSGALEHLRGEIPGLELVVFGQLAPRNPPDLGFPVHYTGHLQRPQSARPLQRCPDALVVPSRQDNLPNTAVEAQACGTPVVAFDIGGLPDIVEHQRTGYLAKAFETEDLAAGIRWVLGNGSPRFLRNLAKTGEGMDMFTLSRERAVAQFSNKVVAEQYRAVYQQIASSGGH
jgi:glycosyltransferase involved in cell wall biosynthesis